MPAPADDSGIQSLAGDDSRDGQPSPSEAESAPAEAESTPAATESAPAEAESAPAETESGPADPGLAAQLAQAEAERDAALAELHTQETGDQRKHRIRRITAVVLVVLFSILLPVTYVVGWTHNVVLTTSGFNRTVDPIASDPRVTAAAGALITNQIFDALQPQQIVANALPPNASFLAGPVTNAAKGYVQTAVTNVLQSDRFQALWKQSIQFAHAQLLAVLDGSSKVVTSTDGYVVLNLVPLLDAALQNLTGFVSGVVGHPVTIPSVSATDVPSDACARIGAAINRTLPANCGQIQLFPANRLDAARRTVKIFNGITLLLVILTPVIAALALWASPRRRRTLLQLTAGGFLGLVVIRRVVIWLESALENYGQPANRSARHAILSHLFNTYFSVSRWVLLGLMVVFAVTLLTGPYQWARTVRAKTAVVGKQGYELAVATVHPDRRNAAVTWMRAHLDLLRLLGGVVAVILLLALSVSWVGFLIIAVLLAGYEFWLHLVGRGVPQEGEAPGDQSGPSEAGPAPVV
jgi:hypothetical protein